MSAPGYLGNYTAPPVGVQLVAVGGYGLGFELMPTLQSQRALLNRGLGFEIMPTLTSQRSLLTAPTTAVRTITVPVAPGTSTLGAERLRFTAVRGLLDRYARYLESAARSNVELSGLEKTLLRREAMRARAAKSMSYSVRVLTTAGWSRGDLAVLERMAASGGFPADQDMPLIRKVGGAVAREAGRLRTEWTTLLAAVRARYAVSPPSTSGGRHRPWNQGP